MKKISFSILLITLFGLSSCHINLGVFNKANKIHHITDVLPEYPGGTEAMMDFIQKNLAPPPLIPTGKKRKVIIRFVVEKDGQLSHFRPVAIRSKRSPKNLEKEAIKVLKKMPKWSPAMNKGKKVRCYMTMPFTFY